MLEGGRVQVYLVGWGVAGGVFLVLKLKLYLIIASMCYQATDHYYSLLDKYTLQSDYCRLGRFTGFSGFFGFIFKPVFSV
jgi:hypothetical protein